MPPRERISTRRTGRCAERRCPQDLSQGVHAVRVNNDTKELNDVAVGFGRVAGQGIRVYVAAFSAW